MATDETHHERMMKHLREGVHHLGTHHMTTREAVKEFVEVNGITALPDDATQDGQ